MGLAGAAACLGGKPGSLAARMRHPSAALHHIQRPHTTAITHFLCMFPGAGLDTQGEDQAACHAVSLGPGLFQDNGKAWRGLPQAPGKTPGSGVPQFHYCNLAGILTSASYDMAVTVMAWATSTFSQQLGTST